MTKVVLGVDPAGVFRPAAGLLRDLAFPDLVVTAMAAAEPIVPDYGIAGTASIDMVGALLESRSRQADEDLLGAAEVLAGMGEVRHEKAFGSASGCLLDAADQMDADLIVSGAERKGFLGNLFLGSVTRTLATYAKHSILIGRRDPVASQLCVVLATDHSDYMDTCLDKLLAMNPAGIRQIHILTAMIIDPGYESLFDTPDTDALEAELEATLANRNAGSAMKLEPICANITTEVAKIHPNIAINAAMEERNADLLIIGARGHGFLERLALGSISMHQVSHTDHNVLVLRP